MDNSTDQDLNDGVFLRLRRAYLLALSLIALALLVEYFLVESFLDEQARDATIINVAGRQRMLSQRIAKLSLLPVAAATNAALDADLTEWAERHAWLKFRLVDDPVRPKLDALDKAIERVENAARTQDAGEVETQSLVADSETFLQQMDDIVGEITVAATARVTRLRKAKRWIGLVTAGLLLMELLFIFRPIGRFIRGQFRQLRVEREAQIAARELAEVAVEEKQRSFSELHALNQAIDQAAIFATLRHDGEIIHLSRKFANLLSSRTNNHGAAPLAELLHPDEGRQTYFSELINGTRAGDWQGEWQIEPADGVPRWLEVSLVSGRQSGGGTEVFLMASDITDRKIALREIDDLNNTRLAEEVERGRLRAGQIVEAQEKERLRVARDLHDGIGQKLTALKFSLESLSVKPENLERNQEKVVELRRLSKEIILGVRLATFNLTPPELMDYGLAPALEKMTRELSRLTGERVVFANENVDLRFEQATEINLYRAVQEAVNNAIKYARANYILVTLSVGERLLSITIDDDGEGFDHDDLTERTDGSGMGLSFMEDRIQNIGGRLFMHTSVDGGTRITMNVPLE